jgi:small-conductance mechanosensitive channel
MATNPPTQASDAIHSRRILSGLRFIVTVALLAVIVVCLVYAWATRDAMANLPFLKRQVNGRGAAAQNAPVDVRPWQTAQALAALVVTAEEAEYARDAERLADHEVDQTFASALREATAQSHTLTGAALTLSKKIAHLQQIVKEDQAAVQKLTQSPPPKTGHAAPVPGADDLAIAKAQLGLDSDELADAQRDLARAVGDERATIQQQLAAHEASMRKYDAQVRSAQPVALASARQERTVATRLKAWLDQHTRYQLLQQALHEAQADSIALTTQHDQLESPANTGTSPAPANAPQAAVNGAPAPPPAKAAMLAALRSKTARRELLSIYDDRIQTQQELASVYGKWSAQVLLQHRIVLHLLLQSFALIAFILLCVVSLDVLVQRLVHRPGLDRRRMYTRRILLTLGIQFVGLALILLIVFGVPRQMPTIVGLATAGLTVVLQDFILAFFGWFVLMGKNGIRVGDWVEINGVGGEVVEVGLLRTTLLETGNWTDKGHPTGRRVTFINSFAVKGQYFNFSTTGQWMWDEIMFSIPASGDAYSMIELIYQAVAKETEQETRLAEEEWQHVTRKNDLSRFTAEPAVSLRPGVYGVEIVVRYVTRASDRFEVRNRLYRRVIGLLQKPLAARAETAPPELQPPQTPIPT